MRRTTAGSTSASSIDDATVETISCRNFSLVCRDIERDRTTDVTDQSSARETMDAVRQLGLPLLVWCCAAAMVAIAAAAFGYEPWSSSTWARWDSGLYEDIARDGYDLFRCEEEPEKWCGDAGWFPAYPWITGTLHALGLPLRGVSAVVAWLFAAGTIVLLWATFLERRSDAAAVAALVYAAF